jgi:hypothetical protein
MLRTVIGAQCFRAAPLATGEQAAVGLPGFRPTRSPTVNPEHRGVHARYLQHRSEADSTATRTATQ